MVVFERSVTHVLENLRHADGRYNARYQRYRMTVMQFIIDLRSEMLKEGELLVRVESSVAELDFAALQRNLPPAPPGAKKVLIGDQRGGNGVTEPGHYI